MSTQHAAPPKQETPPMGFYALMGIVAFGLAVIVIFLVASYFAK
jgi:hypothetical protein